jgi:aspartyl-tRNA(Asn)/glutamyl-tRNA(Gln) amidotransferase subunit B
MTGSPTITAVRLKVGLEVHVELATRTKMFSRVPNPAHVGHWEAAANTLIDPTILALPGSLPVMNKAAVEMAMMVGVALGCQISPLSRWDRKGYFYPDLPKAYQISQYELPLCFDGSVDVPASDAAGFPDLSRPGTRIGIVRAHLEEDAGKLLHEMPGGGAIEVPGGGSIVDYNRAGTPLLEIVTQPDFTSADEVVLFAKMLRNMCRFLGVTEGVMQRGHMRFEPNINCVLTLSDGRTVATPITEVKNLNSFKAVRGAIEYELSEQPKRWLADGRVFGNGTKSTRGWDDARGVTTLQREKEEAHDYRYFPDPDLPPVAVGEDWKKAAAARVPELPLSRFKRYVGEYALGVKEAFALTEERDTCFVYEACIEAMVAMGIERLRAGKVAANMILQSAARRANERKVEIYELGLSPVHVAAVAALREQGRLSSQAADELFGVVLDANERGASDDAKSVVAHVESVAKARGFLIVRDDAALDAWIERVLGTNAKVADDVRSGKLQAAGRLVGEVMKLAGGQADAKTVREAILKKLGAG